MLSTKLLLASLFILGAGCNTVTATRDGGPVKVSEPDFIQRQNFFVFGLAPDARVVNIKTVCKDKPPTQLQTQNTFLDGFLGLITLGIYAPRTAKVWCS